MLKKLLVCVSFGLWANVFADVQETQVNANVNPTEVSEQQGQEQAQDNGCALNCTSYCGFGNYNNDDNDEDDQDDDEDEELDEQDSTVSVMDITIVPDSASSTSTGLNNTDEKNKDISGAVQYLAFYRTLLDNIINAVEEYASQVTAQSDEKETYEKLNQIIFDCLQKVAVVRVELPEKVVEDMFKASNDCQMMLMQETLTKPITNIHDYVEFLKRSYTAMFIATIAVLDKHYELTDEAIAPYVKPFGTQSVTQENCQNSVKN